MTRALLSLMAGLAVFSAAPLAHSASERPKIVGIANIAVKVKDLEAARKFYGQALGYQEAFTLKQAGGGPDFSVFKVNDRQYIEISPELKDEKEDRLIHIAFETADARELRTYFASTQVVDAPAKVQTDAAGNLSFTVRDLEGHAVEFVQYMPKSIHSRNFGKFMPDTRISDHILHVGIYVKNRVAADHFYKDLLGFRPLWEGGPSPDRVRWISLLVPDGSDWVEYMLGNGGPNAPSPRELGGMHHVCLGVMDVQAPYKAVIERGYKPPKEPVIAADGRWLANFYDPDLTRTEIMIRKPVKLPCCSTMHDPYINMDDVK